MVEEDPCPVAEAVCSFLEVGPYLQDTGPGEKMETDLGETFETDPGAQEIDPSCLVHPEHHEHPDDEHPDEVLQACHHRGESDDGCIWEES